MPLPLRARKAPSPKHPTTPLWDGPCAEGPNGGVTQSMIGNFLVCRERFRLRYIEGLRPTDTFSHRLEFGHMWHLAEECLAREEADPTYSKRSRPAIWLAEVTDYARGLARLYPTQQEQVEHWFNVVRVAFPLCVEWWAAHPDVTQRSPLLSEEVFDVPYTLTSGRTVRLRGKWDSVDVVGKGREAAIVLQENKTKGDIDPVQIRRQLAWDLQTMTYLVALSECRDKGWWSGMLSAGAVRGVRYNVVRRPLSGGKGSIVRHKPTKSNPAGESKEAYYNRLAKLIASATGPDWGVGPDEHYFFMRWDVTVTEPDIRRFRRECLDPILEQMVDWYEVVSTGTDPFAIHQTSEGRTYSHHWRHPWGVFNPMDAGIETDLDEYLNSGSEAGLERATELFGELK